MGYVSNTDLQYTLNQLKIVLDRDYKTTVDAAISETSENPVQNKIIKEELDKKQDTLTIDTAMDESSTNTVQNKVVKKYIDDALKDITGIKFEIVDALPTTGTNGVIYLVPQAKTTTQNIYDEYIWVDNKFEKFGSTEADMTGYVKTSDAMTESDINTIFTSIFGA